MKDKDIIYDGKKELNKGHQDNYTKSRKKGYFINIVKEDFEDSDTD